MTATYEGTPRYLPDHASAGRVRVKTKTTFHLSRPRVREGSGSSSAAGSPIGPHGSPPAAS